MNSLHSSQPAFDGLFGVARRDITPPLGIYSRNWGASDFDTATDVHRPLTLSMLVIQKHCGDSPYVLLALDLGWWRSREEEKVLNTVLQEMGVPVGNYVIALSHTHSGPVFCLADAARPGGELIAPYLRDICAKIRESFKDAMGNLKPGIFEAKSGICDLASNRDFPDPNTGELLVGWNPEKNADPTLLCGRIAGNDGSFIATLVNYACHPTVLAWENSSISPDFVGSMREIVEKETGAPCLFLQGASGELAPRVQYTRGTDGVEAAGRSLGHAVLSILFSMLDPGNELIFTSVVHSGAPLALWQSRHRSGIPRDIASRSIDVELVIKRDLRSEIDLRASLEKSIDRVTSERLRRQLLHRLSVGSGKTYAASHHLWKVGEILFVSVPNEAYSILQTSLREVTQGLPLFVITLANGGRGYLSPKDMYSRKSYATWQSPFEQGCLEDTIFALETELKKLL